MKKSAKKSPAPKNITKLNDFVRGFVSTGLVCAIGQRPQGGKVHMNRQVLRQALQGGAALTAAVAAAHAAQRRKYANALMAAAAGAAAVYAIDCILCDPARSSGSSEEE